MTSMKTYACPTCHNLHLTELEAYRCCQNLRASFLCTVCGLSWDTEKEADFCCSDESHKHLAIGWVQEDSFPAYIFGKVHKNTIWLSQVRYPKMPKEIILPKMLNFTQYKVIQENGKWYGLFNEVTQKLYTITNPGNPLQDFRKAKKAKKGTSGSSKFYTLVDI